MKEMKRILALILCLVMIAGMVPVSAIATEEEPAEGFALETTKGTEAATKNVIVETTTSTDIIVGGNEETTVVPGESTDATESTDPTGSTESTDPTGSTESTESTDPTGSTESTESTDPTGSTESTESTDPTGSTESTDPTDATDATEETEPEDAMPVAVELIVPSTSELKADLDEAAAYIKYMMDSNDPASVVANFGTHFTWDNEMRESSKPYLYDWSYYNGVVFEGIEYLYEVTGDETYKDYVIEYMSGMIDANGGWTTCSNNSSKTCAGYNATHGADCYKTASLLLDAYEMTGDSRYLTMAGTLYADLDSAANTYLLPDAGYNFRHTWASDPTPDLWLDGLYMILPFRAEYAKHIGDTEELDLIVSRMQWVSDNMYNESKGLFYHAADSASSNSGTYWLRAIGWYAAAMVDVMDSMSGSNLEAMKVQLKKMADGMRAHMSEDGMWLNNMAASHSSSNPYETSGTALVCYAIMKAVNNGWLPQSYLEMPMAAFHGIATQKLTTTTLKDICLKGVPSGSNSTIISNEGKGVGPFIMLYAELLEHYNDANPTTTGITVEGKTTYTVGDAFERPTVTAHYSNGNSSVVTGFVVNGEYDMNTAGTYTVQIGFSGFTADYTFTVAESEGQTLTGLKVTTYPALKHFVTDEALDITGMVVTATFTDKGETVDVQIPWAETAEDGEGYSVTYEPNLATVGEKTVTVKYTYGDVTLTDTFIVTVYNKTVTNAVEDGEEATVVIEANLPGVSSVTVAESSETVKTAAAELAADAAYVAYDITLTADYAEDQEGLSFKVTMPLPQGEGVAQVWYIPTEEGQAPEQMTDAVDNGDGTVTFTTTHFSDYVSFYAAEAPVSGTGKLPGGKVYTLDTDGTIDNGTYLIVSSGSTGSANAMRNNNGTAQSSEVTITNNKQIVVSEDENIAWTIDATTETSWWGSETTYTIQNGNRYVYMGNTYFLYTSSRDLDIESANQGAYQISYNDYYLRHNNGNWSRNSSSANVYLYEYTGPAEGAAVTFKVDPGSASLTVGGGTATLTGTVTVGDAPVDLSDCTIAWASEDNTKATVSDGIVTGVGDTGADPVYITATLSTVDGTDLVGPITLRIPVTVSSRTATGAELNSYTGSIVHHNSGALSGATITITYDEGEPQTIPVTTDMLVGSFDLNEEGTYPNLTVTYGDYEWKNFTLIVKKVEGEDYPEYPNAGSVSVNKRADSTHLLESGVVQVELSTSGIPIKTGVNVLLIMDISNSMSWDDTEYNYNDTAITFTSDQRLNASRAAAKSFAQTLLAPYADGSETLNTMTMLAFAGIDGDYNDHSTASANDDVYLMSDLAETDPNVIADILDDPNITRKAITGGTNYDYAFQQAYSLANRLYAENGQQVYIVFMTDGAPTHYNGVYYKSRSNTDLTALMNYIDPITGEESRYTSTGNDRNGNDIDSTANTTITFYPTAGGGTQAQRTVQYNKGWSDYIMNNTNGWADKTKALNYVAKVYSIGFGMANGSVTQGAVDAMPTDTNTGGGPYYIPASTTETVLKHMASSAADYYTAEDEDQLTNLYRSLAAQIRQAATNAYFVDQMGDSFNLQLSQYVLKRQADGTMEYTTLASLGVPDPQIQIKNYKIFTAADVGQTLTYTENGTSVTKTVTAEDVGKRYGDPTVVETVTFTDTLEEITAEDGTTTKKLTVTGAYSTAVDNGTTNILGEDGIIYGKYFFYNTNSTARNITVTYDNGTTDTADDTTKTFSLPAESFYWNIGTINNMEWAMTYYEYLAGSMEGTTSSGNYTTNNEAILYYKNWLGNNAFRPTTSPVIGWESANVHYAFYLVNEYGQPIVNQTTGQTGNFKNAVKVTQPVLWDEILLNNLENINTIEAASADIVPYGYKLYDPAASYKIVILSDDGKGSWTIKNTDREEGYVDLSTYVTGYKGDEYTNAPLVYGDEDTYVSGGFEDQGYDLQNGYGYTTTTVWFALVWVPKAIPDAVVIDYGLPVDISVMSNDQFGVGGTSDGGKPIGATLNGIGTLDELEAVTYVENSIHASTSSFDDGDLQLDYGHAAMNGQKVRYTPDTMAWNSNAEGAKSYDKFAYEAEYYYYEDGFAAGEPTGTAESQYYYGEVTVIPATTVYYEDTYTNGVTNEYMTFKTISTETWQEIDNAWTVVGSTIDGTQAEDRPGQYSLPEIDANNVYGYDGAYAGSNMSQFSLGSAHKITVDSSRNGVVEFSFYGTGFDLISLTDNTSGTIFADIIGETNGVEEFFVVDNYYGYVYGPVTETDENGVTTTTSKWYPAESEAANAIYQVPVMKVEGLPYGKYNITLTAAYDKIFDHGQASGAGTGIGGSYDLYVDAIRIYDPAGESAEDLSDVVFTGDTADKNVTIADIYEMDNEGWPQYVEVRNQLISEDTYKTKDEEGNVTDSFQGAIFIDGKEANKSVSDYTNFGPNNEVYLATGQAVAFELDLSRYIYPDEHGVDRNIVADVQLGVKSATGEPVTVKLTTDTSTSGSGSVTTDATRSFITSTDMYYSFSTMLDLGAEKDENGNYTESNDSKTIVTIKNDNSEGIVSITNVKVTFSEQPAEVAPIMTWSLRGANRALMMMSAAPSVEIDPTEPEATEPETSVPEETVPETTVPEETEPETEEPEETKPEETEPDEGKDKLQKELEKALEKAAKEAAKIAKELQKAAEKAAKEAAKALSKLFSGWF